MSKKTKQILARAEADDGSIGDFALALSKQCLSCIHFRGVGVTCDAFPDGIPNKIASGLVDHSKPFPGDNGIMFEKRK